MNPLDSFTVERLEEIINFTHEIGIHHASRTEWEALAKIALAAKLAKPDFHIVRLKLNDAWGSETILNAYENQLDASKCKDDQGGEIIPVYTTAQQAPQLPDGWVMVPKEPTIEMRAAFHKSYEEFENCIGECPESQWAAMIDAAPKPE